MLSLLGRAVAYAACPACRKRKGANDDDEMEESCAMLALRHACTALPPSGGVRPVAASRDRSRTRDEDGGAGSGQR
jgi:hypothetical protein